MGQRNDLIERMVFGQGGIVEELQAEYEEMIKEFNNKLKEGKDGNKV